MICETCGDEFLGRRGATKCLSCQKTYQQLYMYTYMMIRQDKKEIRHDKVEEMREKYKNVNIDDVIYQWIGGINDKVY